MNSQVSPSSSPTQTAVLLSELTQQLHAFFHHLDERRYAELVAQFTPDGRWLRQGQWLDGRAAVRAGLDARPAAQRVRHVITNAYVASRSTDGSEAVVEAYMTAYRHEGSVDGVARIAGPLRLNLVSTVFRRVDADADWLIAEQRLVPEFEFVPA